MMEHVVQVIMIIVCIAIVIIIMYFCCTKCRHTCTIFKYCFPFLPISRIVHTSRRTDLFVKVTNITKGNRMWAHFVSTGCFPTQIQLSRPIQKDDVQIETVCCIFKWIRINWSSINVTGISGTTIIMPDAAYVSICHATGMEEGPKVTLDIQCLRRGGGVALTSMNNYFLHQRGSGSAWAITV